MRTIAIVLVCVLGAAGSAHAQVVFPANTAYVPLHCGNAPMTDLFADDPAALDVRDLVGDANAPAGLRAADATNLYLRMRLEEDPAPNGVPQPFSWGMAFDLDANLATYEVLVMVDGLGGVPAVNVFANTATTLPNDLNDPADQPVAATFPFAMNARSVAAAGTTNGGNPDFFLDFAVPWSALSPLGLEPGTPIRVWAASSNVATSLNGDVACHDGATGTATLTATASDPTTGDPSLDPNPPGGAGRLEGGGGCATSGGAPSLWIALALVGLVRRQRR